MQLVIRLGYLVRLTKTRLVVSLRHTRRNVLTRAMQLVSSHCLTGGSALPHHGIMVQVSVTTTHRLATYTDSMNQTTLIPGLLVRSSYYQRQLSLHLSQHIAQSLYLVARSILRTVLLSSTTVLLLQPLHLLVELYLTS